MAFTWNRLTREGKLYTNGKLSKSEKSPHDGADIDLNPTNHVSYEIGFKKDTGETLSGFISDLMVFKRYVMAAEVLELFSKFLACTMLQLDITILTLYLYFSYYCGQIYVSFCTLRLTNQWYKSGHFKELVFFCTHITNSIKKNPKISKIMHYFIECCTRN